MSHIEVGAAAALAVPTLGRDMLEHTSASGMAQLDQLRPNVHVAHHAPLPRSNLNVFGVVHVVLAPASQTRSDASEIVDQLDLVDPLGHLEPDLGLHP